MNELQLVISRHVNKYPKLNLQDIFKLIYQNEFGCAHFISDFKKCNDMLVSEFENVLDSEACLFDPIGNGFCRINLSAAKANDISAEIISRFFYNSSRLQKGTLEGFRAKTNEFKSLCDSGFLQFSSQEIDTFIQEWEEKGCPLFSHSDVYKKNYNASYRVILKKYEDLTALIKQIWKKSEQTNIVIGIDGRCGAGKTTLSVTLSEIFDCNVIHTDNFFLPFALRTEERLSQPGGNIHYERFHDEIIKGIKGGGPFEYRIFDCASMSMMATKKVYPKSVTIIEGSYSLHPLFKELYDIKVFCNIEPVEQKNRIIKRNGLESYNIFETKWIPMEEKYFQACNIKNNCNFAFFVS